ncbi:hypothetical protein NQ318_002424 [Aromia moschata]|uniref:Protein-lysine N-methyltransferase NQ318_002424 n=1 Tax=Aromia moschata TaxID=1265417 RepID=A0AAV8YEZ1_9CUCU|nr:hypothetical protein NQ318_002424 [Aromia moschata]
MEELNPSELGTHEYWEDRYKDEIENFCKNGDPGDIWFGENISDQIIQWINKTNSIKKDSKIVDIGCGNGMLLVQLAEEGYTNLHGLDYSEKAIELAKAVAQKQKVNISYVTCNILEEIKDDYDIIHDKGTYDAISLSQNATDHRNKYIENMYASLKNDGILLITSCNWTQDELKDQFSKKFEQAEIIPTPQYRFGGKVGSIVSSCVFRKKSK